MELEKIDKKSRELLCYLNTNSDLSSATLADAFNQHYKNNLLESLEVLSFLAGKSLVRVKTDNDERALMIQITHLGRTYEQSLLDQERERKRKMWSDRRWNIITLLLSAIISVVINLIMGGKS